jgi:tetratricopeptide (TPR) repeat protein
MKKFVVSVLLFGCVALPIQAQESTAEPQPTATVITADDLLSQLDVAVLRAEQAADTAEQSVNISGNLLNIFDGIALLLVVGGGLLGLFGVRSIQETRRVNAELRQEGDQLRERFEQEIRKREVELEAVRHNIEETSRRMAAQLQKRTDNALIAISLLELGERQYRANDYDGAISIYEAALQLDPDNPVTHQRLGYVYCQQGNVEASLKHYETAVSITADLASAIAGMGFVTRRIAEKLPPGIEQDLKYNEAEQYLLKALTLSPKLVDDDGESWWGVLGGLYRRRGFLDKAISAYEQATMVTPQSSYGYGNLALLYMKRGDRDKMQKTYSRMENIAASEAIASSGNFWGYADLIVSRLALGMSKQAMDDLPIAINIAPRDADWMLEGLRDTLVDLHQYLDTQRQPAVKNAIDTINNALMNDSRYSTGVGRA